MSESFVVNVAEATWEASPGWGRVCDFELGRARFPDFGINLCVLEPGEVSSMYHGEDGQEDFLVVSGTCLLMLEGEERPLKAWDFVHCPAWTPHTFVGAGDGPCAIVMAGARRDGVEPPCVYPVDPVAARRGASVATETTEPREAYAQRPPYVEEPYRPGTLPGL
jgi:uncharacterized cupin superfamily protein